MIAGAKERALGVMFQDPYLSEEVTWHAGAGGTKAVRAMVRAPDEVQNFSGIVLQAGTLILHLRVADVPGVAASDLFDVRGETRRVQGQPRRDSTGLLLQIDTTPV